MFQAGSQVW